MHEEEQKQKSSRKTRTLDKEIAAATEKLRKLQEKQKAKVLKERTRNHKAILDLLKSQHLDRVSIERWEQVVPRLKELLAEEEEAAPNIETMSDTTNDGAAEEPAQHMSSDRESVSTQAPSRRRNAKKVNKPLIP